jgi:hypothetical protein
LKTRVPFALSLAQRREEKVKSTAPRMKAMKMPERRWNVRMGLLLVVEVRKRTVGLVPDLQ